MNKNHSIVTTEFSLVGESPHASEERVMEDVQMRSAPVAIPVDSVGIRGLQFPLQVRDRSQGSQKTVAVVEVSVDLSVSFKGTHMSRFVQELEKWTEDLDYESMKRLLQNVKQNLDAQKAKIVFSFPYFIRKHAPTTGSLGTVAYQCQLTGELEEGSPKFLLEVTVPVMTVCPCSKAISKEGAHTQRANVHIAVWMNGFSWIEDFVDIAESSASSPVYSLLKRADEKFVTENAFSNPAFVEDVVRNVAQALLKHPQIEGFRVEVESYESIHAHNAFACIEHNFNHSGGKL